ncbi:MAG TPA: phosphoribosylglycinamide formyltransferase [Ignavibacteria bacterium]|nr:phosphoribosylglycinamide formyltransferase [Ignavibacteria bacterium]
MLKINKIPCTLGLNLCVFASGSGSNLKAIIKASLSGRISSGVSLVISNNSGSGALKTAAEYNIPHLHLSQKLFSTQIEFTAEILRSLKKHKVNFILLAGYMKMLDPVIIKKFKNRIINIHPALLPKFGGKGMFGIHVHEAVIAARETFTGATVHFVNEVYDSGAVILQKQVKVKPTDDALTLQKRVLRAEHKLYPEAIKLFEERRVKVRKNKVFIS